MKSLNIGNQFDYTGSGPLDKKNSPVKTKEELENIPYPKRFIGMSVMVLDEGIEYTLVGEDKFNSQWKPKTSEIKTESVEDYSHIEFSKNENGEYYGIMYYEGDDKED